MFTSMRLLSYPERLKLIQHLSGLTDAELKLLKNNITHDITLAESLIENAIGYFPLPLGMIAQLQMNSKVYQVPMAIEETSIIAGLSKTLKWVEEAGDIRTRSMGSCMIGQIQISKVQQPEKFAQKVIAHRQKWIDLANEWPAKSMFERGGGLQKIEMRLLGRPDGQVMGVIHIHLDVCDAMGANVVNQTCEFLKPHIEQDIQEKVTMCILSNLSDQKLVRAEIRLQGVEPSLGERLQEASLFAQLDPYRAATHNKGIMNGIDAVCIATGNDWRAIEAGVHAYAARNGQYTPLSFWTYQNSVLQGVLEIPLAVGIVGGVTKVHPIAQLALKLLNVKSSAELAQVMAAVGLVQNLAALRALVSEGIVRGHMKLHLQNLVLLTNALSYEAPALLAELEKKLDESNYVTATDAQKILENIRGQHE